MPLRLAPSTRSTETISFREPVGMEMIEEISDVKFGSKKETARVRDAIRTGELIILED
jgi:hypothetical protein